MCLRGIGSEVGTSLGVGCNVGVVGGGVVGCDAISSLLNSMMFGAAAAGEAVTLKRKYGVLCCTCVDLMLDLTALM
jgi:hypothetical protein